MEPNPEKGSMGDEMVCADSRRSVLPKMPSLCILPTQLTSNEVDEGQSQRGEGVQEEPSNWSGWMMVTGVISLHRHSLRSKQDNGPFPLL